MAYTSRTFAAPRNAVWDVLIDPTSYPEWLIGAEDILGVDATWPKVGSRFRHRVGIGWLSIPDYSEVLAIEDGRLLQLGVKARPFISGVATFELVSDGNSTVVSLEEEPRVRSVGNFVRPVLDPSIHVRNHRSLRRLDQVVQRRMGDRTVRGRGSVSE
jgi:uncharacterized protein YndB with AHSA1/START domain